jgi:hypothetical protein
VSKRNLFGSRMWWATCSCRKFWQGCHDKAEAERLAGEHLAKKAEREGAAP